MSDWSFAELLAATGGQARNAPGADLRARGVGIDSRTVERNQVFLCLRGDRTDGHEYIAPALEAGAAVLVVEAGRAELIPPGVPAVLVADGLRALQDLARYHRGRLKTRVLGVTGSNGKTSTKEMLAGMAGAMLGADKVFATAGNLNNHIGLPLSVLAIDARIELAVLEMGMNHAGEIELLSRIARPHQTLITSVSGAHREFFASVEDIARAKLEILAGMEAGGTLVYHLYSPGGELALDLVREAGGPRGWKLVFFGGWPDDNRRRQVWPFVSETLDALLWDDRLSMMERLRIDRSGIEFVWQGGRVHCPHYFSYEMAENLLGALALLEATGLFFPDQLHQSAAQARPRTERRFQVLPGASGRNIALLVDDSYNANPDSFIASLRSLRELAPEGRLAVFAGEMAELGAEAEDGHRRVGRAAGELGYELLVACGSNMAAVLETGFQETTRKGRAIRVSAAQELSGRLTEILASGRFDGALVKGSRSARMDLVSDALREQELV